MTSRCVRARARTHTHTHTHSSRSLPPSLPQLILFEECLIDDEGGKCKELDASLSAFEAALSAAPKKASPSQALEDFFGGGSQKERAAARVRAAAAKFGPTQKQVASDWTKKALVLGAPEDGPTLMEQQLTLFGECQVRAEQCVCELACVCPRVCALACALMGD